MFTQEDAAFAGEFVVDFVVEEYKMDGGEEEEILPRTRMFTGEEWEGVEAGAGDERPMVVVLHGLSGGSHEGYLRRVVRPLVDGGWEACVVTSRGCARSRVTTGILYNARATWDIRQVVKWLKGRFPRRPLFGLGFSLGANILVNVGLVDVGGVDGSGFGGLVLTFGCTCVVSRRRGRGLPIECCGRLLEPVEHGSWIVGTSANLSGAECVLENHGNEHEDAF